MFVILGAGALVVIGVILLFLPPDFDQWNEWKHYLYSSNPFKVAAGFIMCTVYAAEFIVWYLVFYQLLRLMLWSLPFILVYLLIKFLTL